MPEAAKSELQRTVDEITGYRKRARRVLIAVAAVAVLALAAAIVAGLAALGNYHENQAQAEQTRAIHQAQLDACTRGNLSRADDQRKWLKFLALATGPHPDAQARAFEAQFIPFLLAADAPVDCAKAYPPPG